MLLIARALAHEALADLAAAVLRTGMTPLIEVRSEAELARAVAVYESGITSREGVERAASLGADAVLVGSSLSTAADPLAAVQALASVPRRGRG